MGVLHRPVLLGPVSFLLLAKPARPESQPLDALENLLPVYEQLLCQIDEPCLDRISGSRGLRSIAPSSQLFTVPPAFQITLNAAVGTDLTGVGACRFCSSRGQIRGRAVTHELREDNGVVVILVVRGIDDRDRPLTRAAPQLPEALALSLQLVAVAGAKLIEALGHVVEPATQLVAWRQLTRPLVQLGALA